MSFNLHINKIEELDKAMEVAKKVFKPSVEEIRIYHDKDDWEDKARKGLFITAWVEDEIVGFTLCYPKNDHLHIWNVAVLEGHRKLGIWKNMFDQIVNMRPTKSTVV